MFYNYSLLRNQKALVFRYGENVKVDGLYRKRDISILVFPASIQPASSLVNLKKKYGDETVAGINYYSDLKNKLNIERSNKSADVIFYRDDYWRVRSSIDHTLILKHTVAEATLMTHPPKELIDLESQAKALLSA